MNEDYHQTEEDLAPHNHECEAALLGACMLDNRMLDEIPTLQPPHFYDPFHAFVFDTMLKWRAEGRLANPVTLRDVVGGRDPTAKNRSAAYLADLTGSGAVLIGAREFAAQLIALADLRSVREIALETVARCEAGEIELDAHALAGDMETKISESLTQEVKRHTVTFVDSLRESAKETEEAAAGGPLPGFEITRFFDWNAACGRMEPGDMILLGARPSMGKTAVAATVALGAAENGVGTDFLSLEMDRRKATRRIMAELLYDPKCPLPYQDLINGKLAREHWRRLGNAQAELETLPLTISDPPVMYVEDVGPHIRKRRREFEKRGQDLQFIVLDYIGRLLARRKLQGETEIVSYISRTLKHVAKENDVVLLALSQLSRAIEQRENKRPMLADLRQSGSLEQDADTVLFLFREEYYLERSEPKQGTAKWQEWADELAAVRDNLEIYSSKRREGALTKRTAKFLTSFQAVLDHNDPRVGGVPDLFEDSHAEMRG